METRQDVENLILFKPEFEIKNEAYYLVNCPYCSWSEVTTYDKIERHMKDTHKKSLLKDRDGNIFRQVRQSAFGYVFIDHEGIPYPSIEECCKARNLPVLTLRQFRQRVADGETVKAALTKPMAGRILTKRASVDRIGETKVMKNGLKATIIEYTNSDHIKIRYESGVERTISYSNFKKGSGTIHGRQYITDNPELVKFWDYEKNEEDPAKTALHKNQQFHWICSKGHRWQTFPNNLMRSLKCPFCYGYKIQSGINDLATLYPELLSEWDFNKNEKQPTECSSRSSTGVWWKCGKCGQGWKMNIFRRTQEKRGCPFCRKNINRKSSDGN